MRSLKEISVGNGWYWLAGTVVALFVAWTYVAVVRPILPALAWHRAHSRKMRFAEFNLDVPLLWSVPKADFEKPDDIDIEKAILPGQGFSLISLTGPPARDRFGVIDPEAMWPHQNQTWVTQEKFWAKLFGAANTTRMTYRLAADSMDCLYQANGSVVILSCFNRKTGSSLDFIGSRQDYLKLHEIVR